jgi:cell division protein FtsI (penicillin-binding protein 3)
VKEQKGHRVSNFRLGVVTAAIVFSSAGLMYRAIDLHVFSKDFLQNQGDARYLRTQTITAHRGMITDRNGEPLAISTPVDSVWVQPDTFTEAYAQWPKLASLLHLDLAKMKRKVSLRKKREFIYLKRHINPTLAKKVMDLKIPGVSLQREYQRYYPAGEVMAHIVGYTNVDDQGIEGLELAYNNFLGGVNGSKRVLKDRLGRVVRDVEQLKKPQPGNNLTLSIDRRLQYLAYRELKRAVQKHKAVSGSAVILDIQTGEVLAMVNQPSYNPNNRSASKSSHRRNRAVTDLIEPGSTIKPFTLAAALESGRYTSHTMINTAPGRFRLGKAVIRDTRNYGRINIETVLQKSSNVGASKIALSLPVDALWKINDRMGFGMTTGSGFPGEVNGLLSHARLGREIERATLAYGYGMSVTPLQLTRAYSVLGSNGILRPVSFIRTNEKVKGKRVISSKIARQIRGMMEKVVQTGGTGTKAQIAGYRVAGKTGTAKKAIAGGYSKDRYISIFAGIAPASYPRLAMVVSINEPRAGVYYGGEVAAPVFSKVMSGSLRLLGVTPDNIKETQINLAAFIKASNVHVAGSRP